jgi:predicted ATPase
LAHCVDHGLAEYECWAGFNRGALLVRQGELQCGLEIIRDALMAAEKIGYRASIPHQLGSVAAAHARLDQPEVGLALLNDAISETDKTSGRFAEAELHRLRGELLLMLGKKGEAETSRETALAIARQQRARFWELRAATTLAQHWREKGKLANAYDLLHPVYGWFTEGFDTADLKAAKALLDELEERFSEQVLPPEPMAIRSTLSS